MSSNDIATRPEKPPVVPRQYLVPFVLTTCCFALWGFANDFTNPLVKVYENVFVITTSQASWLQFAFYTGYFCMALPASLFIRRFSYKAAIMVGFSFYILGALLAVPAASTATFGLFLLGSYVLTYGLAFLETACNPYILAMGPRETGTQRLNLAQAFNPVGSLVGMGVATLVLAPQLQTGEFREKLGDRDPSVVRHLVVQPHASENSTTKLADGTTVSLYAEIPEFRSEVGALDAAMPNALKGFRSSDPDAFFAMQRSDLDAVKMPYIVIAVIVTLFLVVYAMSSMPTFSEQRGQFTVGETVRNLFSQPRFREGVAAQGFYVGAQIMCWTFIVHYGMEQVGLSLAQAQSYNIVAMVIFLCSRWICTALLRVFSPGLMLTVFACGAFAFTLGAIYLPGKVGLTSLVMISACMSLMFPTIYGISLHSLTEEESKLGSAFLIMAIVGGAVLTKLQGGLIDAYSVRVSFWLPATCFLLIALYGLRTFVKFEREVDVLP
ncbi:MFS transporter [Roseiconus nitratireducens]|uniref:MFS transporter n=1 Tax=Roseiconus nitratireducens TaxID=2605748 RepID=A0A5M6CT29_9BACT|nr:MFS transporter [Roseiconus nitratireducens]KAA5537540.1 MFS transporter [Roseiconus nitratireducens]